MFIWYAGFFLFGLIVPVILKWLNQLSIRHAAKIYAQDIIEEAKYKANDIKTASQLKIEDIKELSAESSDALSQVSQPRVSGLKNSIGKYKNTISNINKKNKKKISKLKDEWSTYNQSVQSKKQNLKNKQQKIKELEKSYGEKILSHFKMEKEQITNSVKTKLLRQTEADAKLNEEAIEQNSLHNAERDAKNFICRALSRFQRPYCPERNLGYFVFKNEKQKKTLLGPENSNLPIIEEVCGIDIIYKEANGTLSFSGFDPVRRELGRRTVQKLSKDRSIDRKRIEQIAARCKKDLLENIKRDGNKIAKELKLNKVSKEVRNMMGALRYRYSYTQNQYYHCAEVGHMCGILSSELGIEPQKGRRAGLFHDIGKAMDHSVDGGHAVIGADFIEKNGEEKDVVHAVRAHHFDETPSTDLAYLVIAADALSGARPGARRATTTSYNQKVDQIQNIVESFDGVTDAIILSSGREVRVRVDAKKVSDKKALELSKQMTTRIEEECNYPGSIKLTVMRRSQASYVAKRG